MDEEFLEKEEVLKYFQSNKNGYFVEVGANSPGASQTQLLAKKGWKGVLIEPLKRFYEALVEARPDSSVYQVACSSPDKIGQLYIHIPDSTGNASLEKNVDDMGLKYSSKELVDVVTLDSILEKENVTKVDFISIDVEGVELDVLKGFNLKKYSPDLILMEDKLIDLTKHRYLKKHGYKLVKRTTLNDWYVPNLTNFTQTSFSEQFKLFRKVYFGLPFRKFRRFKWAIKNWINKKEIE